MKCPYCELSLYRGHDNFFSPGYPAEGLPTNWRDLNPQRFQCSADVDDPNHVDAGVAFICLSNINLYYFDGDKWIPVKPPRIPKHKGILIGTAVNQP